MMDIRDLDSYEYLKEALLDGDRDNLKDIDEQLKTGKLQLEFINTNVWKIFKDMISAHLQDAIKTVSQPEEKNCWSRGYLYAQLEFKAWALGIEPYLRGLEQQRAEIILSESEAEKEGGME